MSKVWRRIRAFCLFAACAWASSVTLADSWAMPEVRHYLSSNGAWRLTVYPRELESKIAYFEDKVASRPNAGGVAGSTQDTAQGMMEHMQGGKWRTIWKKPLNNEVAPVDALVSNNGVSATFDNWHSMGYGENVVTIYGKDGVSVRAFGLADFLPEEFVHALPHSVSSIQWRGKPRIAEDEAELVIPVVVPSPHEDASEQEKHVDVRFLLVSGQHLMDTSGAWAEALESARKADAQLLAAQAAARQRFISPLSAPKDGNAADWHGYLREAFFRVDPDWAEGYPAIEVVPLPDEERFALLSGHVGDELLEDVDTENVIMIAGRSQDVLVDVLRTQSKRVSPGTLAKVRIYVAVDDAHIEQARIALAPTGASVRQLDIDSEIPQRKERLERYLNSSAETKE